MWLLDSRQFRAGDCHVLFSLDSFGPGRSNQSDPFHHRNWSASPDVQGIKKHIDKVFIATCIVTNLVRNALWVARLEDTIEWDSVWAFQHLYFGVEWMTLLNIWWTARLSNLAKYQNQEKVHIYLLCFELLTIPFNRPIAQYVFSYCQR